MKTIEEVIEEVAKSKFLTKFMNRYCRENLRLKMIRLDGLNRIVKLPALKIREELSVLEGYIKIVHDADGFEKVNFEQKEFRGLVIEYNKTLPEGHAYKFDKSDKSDDKKAEKIKKPKRNPPPPAASGFGISNEVIDKLCESAGKHKTAVGMIFVDGRGMV